MGSIVTSHIRLSGQSEAFYPKLTRGKDGNVKKRANIRIVK